MEIQSQHTGTVRERGAEGSNQRTTNGGSANSVLDIIDKHVSYG